MKSSNSVVKIGISGSYGGFNLGDEAILYCILKLIRSSVKAHITVFSKDPSDTIKRHRVERAVPVKKLTRDQSAKEIEKLDLFILGGGGILYDGDVKAYLREPLIALEKKVPFMVYAISAGPLLDNFTQTFVKECLERADIITVRDYQSKHILEEIGIRKEIYITAYPALLLDETPISESTLIQEGITPGQRLVGISVREPGLAAPDIKDEHYHLILANTADYMIDRFNAFAVFVPMERKVMDLQHCHAVISLMLRPQHATVLQGNYTSGELLSIISKFNLSVGMRLHFLIFSALKQIPLVGLPYSPKVNGFLEELRLEMPPIHLVNAGRLIAHIDRAWDNKFSVLQRINRYMPELKNRAQINNDLLLSLLR